MGYWDPLTFLTRGDTDAKATQGGANTTSPACLAWEMEDQGSKRKSIMCLDAVLSLVLLPTQSFFFQSHFPLYLYLENPVSSPLLSTDL